MNCEGKINCHDSRDAKLMSGLASRLGKRITIQEEALTTGDAGGQMVIWSDFVKIWAEIKPLNGRERLQSEQLNSSITHTVTIRHIDGVNADMRIIYQGRVFNVIAVINPFESNIVLEILCEENVAV